MVCISGNDVDFSYRKNQPILENLNFEIESGKITAILGRNGCGKSTLIKLLSALVPLSSGKISVCGVDINSKEDIPEVRKHCGIVFQNPDNQFVSPIVEDDISFGLTNHHIPESEHKERIRSALKTAGMDGFEKRSIFTLSGGQKQRIAVAGILAIDCDILIFDESTSMLDPEGKEELNQVIRHLRSKNKTIIVITQNITDVLQADQILLMSDHRIIFSGTAREVLTNYECLKEAGVEIPFSVRVYHDLLEKGIRLNSCPLTVEELAEEICNLN